MLKCTHYTTAQKKVPLTYWYQDGVCVYTGLESEVGSTINYAEDIIAAIAEKEGFDPSEITFFDLQTWKGYDGDEGVFAYDKLVFKNPAYVENFEPTVCPAEVIEEFQEFIGKSPRQSSSVGDRSSI